MSALPRLGTRALAALAVSAAAAAGAGEPAPAPIRVGQIGFEVAGPKIAVLAAPARAPLDWALRDAAGRIVAQGRTQVFGDDAASGEHVHRIDFSQARAAGTGFRLHVGARQSHAFAIRTRPFASLATGAMAFFYQQRSGVPILAAHVERPDLARPAGHAPDRATCFAGVDQQGVRWPGCDYRMDASGGWYDAGDHGKYVVNGALSVWTLLDLHQRLAAFGDPNRFADGTLALPERGNGRDDLLDEARVQVEFLLAMQIADRRLTLRTQAGLREIDAGGLVHSKIADVAWTALPTAPADDRQPRFLYPPTTAATLNLAAVAAQAALVWRDADPAFAARALAAARRAWDAAARHPDLFAGSGFDGSGGYGDDTIVDERFWAAAELLAATGEAGFAQVVVGSPFLAPRAAELGWSSTDLAGVVTLATAPGAIPPAVRDAARARVLAVADRWIAERARSGYGLPYASTRYNWGSNSTLLNRALVLGVAWQLTGREPYRDGAVAVVDYIVGRNPLDRSYVTGFGVRPMRQPHHRFWMGVADRRYPAPPAGVLSGGPNNTAMTDDVSRTLKGRCAPQTCWRDDWRAFTFNEVAINWNAPLVWVAGFLDATRDREVKP